LRDTARKYAQLYTLGAITNFSLQYAEPVSIEEKVRAASNLAPSITTTACPIAQRYSHQQASNLARSITTAACRITNNKQQRKTPLLDQSTHRNERLLYWTSLSTLPQPTVNYSGPQHPRQYQQPTAANSQLQRPAAPPAVSAAYRSQQSTTAARSTPGSISSPRRNSNPRPYASDRSSNTYTENRSAIPTVTCGTTYATLI